MGIKKVEDAAIFVADAHKEVRLAASLTRYIEYISYGYVSKP